MAKIALAARIYRLERQALVSSRAEVKSIMSTVLVGTMVESAAGENAPVARGVEDASRSGLAVLLERLRVPCSKAQKHEEERQHGIE